MRNGDGNSLCLQHQRCVVYVFVHGKTTVIGARLQNKCKERAREMEREIRCLKCFSWKAAGVLCGSSTQNQNTLLLLEEVPCFT